ncbi:Transposase IS4 [Popillia japonica]|uniref:Transposase IS4 n=1 Tax=Popillia japonica TaxID=7064 RepID=A0AAW1MYK0_POPJA
MYIFIEPPDANVLTDKDSGDEEEGGLVDNLSGQQLLAGAEVRLKKPANEEPDESAHEVRTRKDHLVRGRYNSKWKNPKISSEEMKCTISIMILTGYHELPGKDMYWSTEKVNVSIVSDAIRRDRFRQIVKYLHCADNAKPNYNDKMWKLRPLMDYLRVNFTKNFSLEEHLNFDESMVTYFGRHPSKQFIHGKPIRFGCKVWCLSRGIWLILMFTKEKIQDEMLSMKMDLGNVQHLL